jgi:hypothetical protein
MCSKQTSGKCHKKLDSKHIKCHCDDSSSDDEDCTMTLTQIRSNKSIDKAIDYKDAQKETVESLKEIATNITTIIQNAASSSNSEIGCFKPEALSSADQYIKLSCRACAGVKISSNGNGKFYGTVDASGRPIFYDTGLGGSNNTDIADGSIIVNNNNFQITAGDDIAYIADKIKGNSCGEFATVDGEEFGLTINSAGTLEITIKSATLGDDMNTFIISGTAASDYETLVDNFKENFEAYISLVWFDTANTMLRVIMKRGYTIVLTASSGSFTVTTYVNNIIVSTTALSTSPLYLWGYLLFYASCNPFAIVYSEGLLDTEAIEIQMTRIMTTNIYYQNNITFDLTNLWCCEFNTVSSINVQFCRSGINRIDIKAFVTYGQLLKNIIKYLDFDCSQYDLWRRTNANASIDSLISLLDCINILIDSQKDMLVVLKCDYKSFTKKCCSGCNKRKC